MMNAMSTSLSQGLSLEEINKIKACATMREFEKDQAIFSEGDNADYIYFIESGLVSIFIDKFSRKEQISALGPGYYFGEMAFLLGDKRSASAQALEASTLLTVDRDTFLKLLEMESSIKEKINTILAARNEELTQKENMFERKDIEGGSLHIGISGDPSLRESAFSRERYYNVVDEILPMLQCVLYDLLVNRNVYEFVLHFNSGEVHTKSIFSPFSDEIHQAKKLLDKGYLDRHFPLIPYEEKIDLVRRSYNHLDGDASMNLLPDLYRENLKATFQSWHLLEPHKVANTISRLDMLRKLQNFYIRNFTMSSIADIIRLQFNCDGTHILNADGFQEFLENNIVEDEPYLDSHPDRRKGQRRTTGEKKDSAASLRSSRRSIPGRRQKDWLRLS